MGLLSSGVPVIELYDAQGKDRAGMWVAPSGAPNIFLFDAQGNMRADMSVGPSGAPGIELKDAQGFTMDLGGASTITLATGETHQTSADSIVMFGNDKKRHVIWQAP